jgi:hypothetical protein
MGFCNGVCEPKGFIIAGHFLIRVDFPFVLRVSL